MQRQLDERRRFVASSMSRTQLSSTGGASTGAGGHPRRAGSRLSRILANERENLVRDHDLSFMSRGNIIHKIPQTARVAAQTYLMATQPAANDLRATMHRSTLMGLGMTGASLIDKEVAPRTERSPRHRNNHLHEVATRMHVYLAAPSTIQRTRWRCYTRYYSTKSRQI
jgi:hypothetical protein